MAFCEIWEWIIKQNISLTVGGWDPPLWTSRVGCVSHLPKLALEVAGLLTFPTKLLWAWDENLRWEFRLMNPVSGLKIFLWLSYVLRPRGGQPTLHYYGANFLVCGSATPLDTPVFHCAFWMLASHSPSALPPKCRLGSWEKELGWSTRHSISHASIKCVVLNSKVAGISNTWTPS